MSIERAGIKYKRPEVFLIQESGLGVAELAGRTAYNSFDKSENREIRVINKILNNKLYKSDPLTKENLLDYLCESNNIDSSDLLDKLAHVYHHDSVLEHIYLQYLVKGTSRGVLQEHARHRIQSITVQSTRYTMSSVINAFIASDQNADSFSELIYKLDMFILDEEDEDFEIRQLFDKLFYQYHKLGKNEFLKFSLSSDNLEYILNEGTLDNFEKRFETLQANKQKRNVGDNFKWIVTDNWKVDLVFSMNLRALSNYLKLRDSGAAYFQIQWLAEEIIKATPQKYLNLISKKYRKEE